MKKRLASIFLGLALFASACNTTTGTQPNDAVRAQAVTAWHDAAQCFRDHGFPAPDPAIDDQGKATFPEDLPRTPDDVLQACADVLNRIPNTGGSEGQSPAGIQARRQFALCMRANGVRVWPDPDAEGRFPNTPELAALGKSPALVAATATCRHYLSDGGN